MEGGFLLGDYMLTNEKIELNKERYIDLLKTTHRDGIEDLIEYSI